MGLFKSFKNAIESTQEVKRAGPAAPVGQRPTEKSIYQSRENFGVNFGSLFVLEKYIFDEMFIDGTSVELDAITKSIEKSGIEETKRKLENHWLNYASDDDWQWLKEKGVQSIRIPIGYWIVDGGSFAKNTSFYRNAPVYENAWTILKQNYIEKAKQYHISVLVDLHALPMGANTGDHSGESFKNAGFWSDRHAIDKVVDICQFIAKDLKKYDNISAIQIVNESVFDNNPKGQEKYYTKAINAIRDVDMDVPIIISDGWWADQWVQFLDRVSNKKIGDLGVVIDEHIYRCFDNKDKQKSVNQIIDDLDSTVLTGLSNEADFIVGEYSCVLDGQSWDRSKETNRDEAIKNYGNKQCLVFNNRSKTGSYFWTYKFQHGDGGEWGFRPMVERGCIPCRKTSSSIPDEGTYNGVFEQAYRQHQDYWKNQNPNENYEFWRYQEGFVTGWNDAVEFAKFDNSKIGRLAAWKYSRKSEHIRARGESGFLWQWEAGFEEGIDKFNHTC